MLAYVAVWSRDGGKERKAAGRTIAGRCSTQVRYLVLTLVVWSPEGKKAFSKAGVMRRRCVRPFLLGVPPEVRWLHCFHREGTP
jgi:hypothetical protein